MWKSWGWRTGYLWRVMVCTCAVCHRVCFMCVCVCVCARVHVHGCGNEIEGQSELASNNFLLNNTLHTHISLLFFSFFTIFLKIKFLVRAQGSQEVSIRIRYHWCGAHFRMRCPLAHLSHMYATVGVDRMRYIGIAFFVFLSLFGAQLVEPSCSTRNS